MECLRESGYYKTTFDLMPTINGSYIYSVTYLNKNIDTFTIYTQRGIICKSNIIDYFDNLNETYDGLIIDYIIKINDWDKWDKRLLLHYNDVIKKLNVKMIFKQFTSNCSKIYDRNLQMIELLYIKNMLAKVDTLSLVFLNTNITNLYRL
tara:strand:- start:71 stop:520 length:450 start_codon:yes stop_codon:yes gene_type:complete